VKSAQAIANKARTAILGALGRGAAGSVTNNATGQLNAAPIGPSVSATWALSAFVSATGKVFLSGQVTLSKNGGTLTAGDEVTFTLLEDGTPIGSTTKATATTDGGDVIATSSLSWVNVTDSASHVYAIRAAITGGVHTGGFLVAAAALSAIDI
jgi:hypothetical protein